MCAHGRSCSTFAPGHALHLIQTRLVSATPSEWVDAIVESVSDDVVTLRAVTDASTFELWNGNGAASALAPGAPVALHPRYHVLAVGARWFNVLLD